MNGTFLPSPLAGEGAPKGRMRGLRSLEINSAWGEKPLTRLALRAIHPLPQGERGRGR
jgi:hypothetical protein